MVSIKSRLIFYVLFATIIPVLAFLLYSILFVNEGFRDSEIDANETKITWSRQYLEQVNEQVEDIVYSLHLEENILQMVDNSSVTFSEIEDVVKDTLYNNSNILTKVTVISTNTYRGVSFDYENGFNSTIYYQENLFLDSTNDAIGIKYVFNGSDILVLHTMNDFNNRDLNGLIILKLSDEILKELDLIFGDDAHVVLYTSEYDLVNHNDYDMEKLKEHYDSYQIIGDSAVWTERVNGLDLYISHIVPIKDINAFSRSMFGVGLFIILVSFVLTSIFSVLVTNDITAPIISLTTHMKENELVEYVGSSPKYQEIEVLKNAYNSNIKEINDLITEKFKNEIERQSIQLRALQAQINPHFLSNTFQLIGGMALEKDAEDIYEATIKMSKLVRYSMRIEQKAVSITEELEHINGYLDIQKLRFGNRLNYLVEIDERLESYKIPKFTIQPIIENSFKYGLKKVSRLWEIKITNEIKEKVYIHVTDNGVGMSEENMLLLNDMFNSNNTSLENDKKSNSVGLSNINARIKLLYGEEYGLTISNLSPYGLRVTITLPLKGVE